MNLSLLRGLIREPIRKTFSLDAVLIKVKDARNREKATSSFSNILLGVCLLKNHV